jgi:transcriptional regulator with XRE-family HTH domain
MSKAAAKHLAPRATDDTPELAAEQLGRFKRRDPAETLDGYVARGFRRSPLEGIRKANDVTQVALADAAEMTQAEISRLERRKSLEGVRVETLRRYVEALGGKLELVARFPSTGHLIGLGGAPTIIDEEADDRTTSRASRPRRR